jgi:hypothetical protein
MQNIACPLAPVAQLMFKLRKELGEADYARIFDDPKVRGHDVWGAGGR